MEATLAEGSALRSGARRFHFWMAVVFLSVAFGGFIPTYWARVATGTFHEPPIPHIHGALLFTWTVFYFIQTAWIASGRTRVHRAWDSSEYRCSASLSARSLSRRLRSCGWMTQTALEMSAVDSLR
jgi:hypothetical protein